MAKDGERMKRAASFASVAALYERARPGYPVEAVRWLAGETPCDVVDLGAGTGKLTASLLALGHRVTAVEPLAEMREQLAQAVPGVRALAGTAEEMPLPDACADVVTVAQAFHWFDHGSALPEVARVLRPGGVLAIAWNIRDDAVPWVARLSGIIGAEHMSAAAVERALAADGRFSPPESAVFRHVVSLGREMLREFVRSRSHYIVLPRGEQERILAEVDSLFDAAAGPRGLELPYRVECFRALRAR